MVIAKRIVEYAPLEALFDSDPLRKMSGRRVLHQVAGGWHPKIESFNHQYLCLGCQLRFGRFLHIVDTGLGKTKLALDAIDYYFMTGGVKHALVLTGRPISTGEWVEQAAKFLHLPTYHVEGSASDRREKLGQFPKAPVTVTDYATLSHTFSTKVKKGRSKSTKLVPDHDTLEAYGRLFDLVVLDEIHQLKNPTTLRYQMVRSLVSPIQYRIGLTGTMLDRHPEDAWAQMDLIDDGATFGRREDFIRYFFNERPAFYSKFSTEIFIKKEKKEEFRRRLRNRAIRITKNECPDVPTANFIEVKLSPPKDAIPHLKAAHERMKKAREEESFSNEFMFLRQLCSGLLRVKDESINTTLRLSSSPKLNWLLGLLEELPKQEQVVVFYEFRESGAWIAEELKAKGHTYSLLTGGMQSREQEETLASWKRKRTRVLLSQTQMAAESLNLQQCAYLVQYERPTTYRLEKQAIARVAERIGGRHSLIYQPHIKGSVELRVLKLIHEGKQLSRELLEGVTEDEPTRLL